MDNSLLAVRDINHKYIVVEQRILLAIYSEGRASLLRNHNHPIQKVAVAAGGGNMTNEMRIAVQQRGDTYVTGEYVLYSQQYAEYSGMNLFVGSHTNTEILGVESMVKLLGNHSDVQLIRIWEPNY